MAGRRLLVVPAEKFTPAAATVAVTTDPLNPKLTPFEFESVKALRFWLVVPAERLTQADAVMVDPARPKLRLLEFESVTAVARVPPPVGSHAVALPVATPTTSITPAVLLNPMLADDPTDVFPISRSGPT
jgi:hypothetical protein